MGPSWWSTSAHHWRTTDTSLCLPRQMMLISLACTSVNGAVWVLLNLRHSLLSAGSVHLILSEDDSGIHQVESHVWLTLAMCRWRSFLFLVYSMAIKTSECLKTKLIILINTHNFGILNAFVTLPIQPASLDEFGFYSVGRSSKRKHLFPLPTA